MAGEHYGCKVQQWRFVFETKWLAYALGTLVFVAICFVGSYSQWQVRGTVVAAADLQSANYDRAPVALSTLLPSRTSYDAADEFRQVRVTGHYLTNKTYLARDRSYNDNPGFEVLVPLETANGSVFIVDRGWLATGTKHDAPDSVPAPTSGTVTVVARLAATEGPIADRTDIAGTNEVAVIDLPDLQSKLQLPTYVAAYGQMVRETPAVVVRPTPLLKPVIDYGPTLWVAIAAFIAGLVGIVMYIVLITREHDRRYGDPDDEAWYERLLAQRRARLGPDDKEVEDALLDEAGYDSSAPGRGVGRGV
ncbi:SURF1 family protein [Frondihabitans cladoniiphilus]|uniref:SURF1-like protein n=1 Tax=Frondihabitans cladoniiphilus TaxID=715785 RepID=A0ABP8W4G5_9MICO